MRRKFNKQERHAVQIVTNAEGEADHIVPFSGGGKTAVENCQLLPSEINRRKGGFQFTPREWQRKFIRRWYKRESSRPFMLIAIPGSGKTMAALDVASKWMQAGPDRRVIVVVPSDNLRQQWSMEAVKFGLQLQTKEFGTDYKHGFQGGVVTYQLVARQPLVFRKLCSVAPTMVIFDEIHHCGDESNFGEGIKNAFELATEKLLMSGTPWKTDGTPIPFVRYDGNGFAVADYRYDYPNALNDDVVRYLVFDHAGGSITHDITGKTYEIDKSANETDAAFALRRLLDAGGGYVRQQIADAHRKLVEYRKSIPDAGALAVCMDQCHAMKVAKVIEEITGTKPSVIVSDTELETDTVDTFRKSSKEWLVSVRKVSEGTDIKRLQVLCYLTNTTSELFFRQVIGRVSRVRDMEDYEGYVYLPADPRLIKCAQNISNAQVQAVIDHAERESRDIAHGEQQPDFDTYTTDHKGVDTIIIDGEVIAVQEAKEIEQIATNTGVPMKKVLSIKQMLGLKVAVATPEPNEPAPLESQMDHWRKKCNKKANHLAHVIGAHVGEIHGRFKPQSGMTLDELKSKYNWLINQLRSQR